MISLPAVPLKEGYEFKGWYLDKGTWNIPFSAESLLDEKPTGDISVYAKWEKFVYMVIETAYPEIENDVSEEELDLAFEKTIDVLKKRLISLNFVNPIVERYNGNFIRIKIDDSGNAEELFYKIRILAVLEFRDAGGTVLLTGSHLQSAYPTYNANNIPAVGLTLNEEGTAKFAEATSAIGKTISIYFDDELIVYGSECPSYRRPSHNPYRHDAAGCLLRDAFK